MNREKIIFIDVDGTLVNYSNQLPESAVTAIREARKNGHRVYICTGRSEAEVPDEIWNIGLDGMIGGNGSYVKDHDTVVMHQLITKEQCQHIVQWLNDRHLEFYLESNNGLFASPGFNEAAIPVVQEYQKRKGRDTSLLPKQVFHGMVFDSQPEDLIRDDLNKVSFILSSYQDHLDSITEFPDLKPGTWGGAGETALFGDLGVKDIDKGHAIDVLLSYLHGDIHDTMAFGDAKVDIPMLEKCEIGVAVNSGGDEIKAMADYVTDDVDNDGIYKAFVHFHLIDDICNIL